MLYLPSFSHLLFTESSIDQYSGSSFPGLSDALVNIQDGKDVDNQWEVVKKHYSVLLFSLQSATSVLKDVADFVFSY